MSRKLMGKQMFWQRLRLLVLNTAGSISLKMGVNMIDLHWFLMRKLFNR